MIETIRPNLFRIPVPLPGNPLKELNSYLIRGRARSLLIDTGFRQEPCRQALLAGLEELGVRREETDVLLTHLHSDHSGLAPEFVSGTGRIYISDVDRRLLEDFGPERWKKSDAAFAAEGFPPALLARGAEENPARALAPAPTDRYVSLFPGDVVEAGDYRLRCLATPGHTPGHLCFWCEEEGILFSGDHVLFDIPPNSTAWTGVADSLGDYLNSLETVRACGDPLVLPGHRGRGSLGPRIDALLAHHQRRLDEALKAVREHPGLPAYDLAGYLTWKIRAASWAEFPLAQKWFAVGECMAHLDHLTAEGLIRRETGGDGIRRYELA